MDARFCSDMPLWAAAAIAIVSLSATNVIVRVIYYLSCSSKCRPSAGESVDLRQEEKAERRLSYERQAAQNPRVAAGLVERVDNSFHVYKTRLD